MLEPLYSGKKSSFSLKEPVLAVIFFISLFVLSGDPVFIKGTGIPEPLMRDSVQVAKDGTVFILDQSEQTIKRYDDKGEDKGVVGRKGEGPGEYTSPWALYLEGDEFFVRDRRARKVIVYNLKGEFIRNIKEPVDGLDIARVAGGWATGSWRLGAPESQVVLQLVNEDLLQPRKILEWSRAGTDGVTDVRLASTGLTRLPYNPAKNLAMMVPSLDLKTLFVYQPAESFRIAVVDVATGSSHFISLKDVKRMPFNNEWGKERLKEQQEDYNRRGLAGKLQWIEGFPKFFPWVREMLAGPNGTLVIKRWSMNPDKSDIIVVVDAHGKSVNLPYKKENEERILATHDGQVLLSVIIEEQAAILKVRLADVDKTAAAYPFPEEE